MVRARTHTHSRTQKWAARAPVLCVATPLLPPRPPAESLVTHLEGNGVEFHQLAFRWMNCLLMRELPFALVVRLWDTCLAERDGVDSFYVFVCAALLLKFAPRLKGMKFQELVTFIQRLPTKNWTVQDLEELLAQSYVLKTVYLVR